MRLTLFEILFGAIVVVLAFLPIIFLVYLKHHSEVLKNFELRRNRQTFPAPINPNFMSIPPSFKIGIVSLIPKI